MIYGFLSDTAMHYKAAAVDVLTTSTGEGVADRFGMGYYTSEIDSYFQEPVAIIDSRSSRSALGTDSKKCVGSMSFFFDKVISSYEGMDNTGYQNAALITALNAVDSTTAAVWTKTFFDIVEYAMMNIGTPVATLNSIFNTTAFPNYVADTFNRSENSTGVDKATLYNDSTLYQIEIPNWVEFGLSLSGVTYLFKVYIKEGQLAQKYTMSGDNFIKDYPVSSIITPISATSVLELLNSFGTNGTTASVVTGANNIFNSYINNGFRATSLAIFTTKYWPSNASQAYNLPFGILYHGATPASGNIKSAIKLYLTNNSASTTNATWQTLFPELFATSYLYIAPLWSNSTVLSSSSYLSGTLDYQYAMTTAKSIFKNIGEGSITDEFIEENLEIVRVPTSDVYLLTLPSANNEIDSDSASDSIKRDSFHALHPTYIPVSSSSTNFTKQAPETQQMSIKLSSVVTALENGTSTDATTTVGSSYQAVSFTVGAVTYYVFVP